MAERMVGMDDSGSDTVTKQDDAASGALGTGLGALLGGLLNSGSSRAAYDDMMKTSRLGLNAFQQLQIPDVEKMKIYLEELQSQGVLNPYLEEQVQQGDSNLSTVTLDPRLRNAQQAAMEQMAGIAQTGTTDIDRAALQDMLRQSSAAETAARADIINNRAARGMAGSGDELASALAASQGASNQRSDQALKLAAQAMQNRLGALTNSSSMAKALEDSDYGRQSDLASQRDSIARFNASTAQGVNSRNTAIQNNTQAQNLAQAQALHDANTATRNQQQTYNKELLQQDYQNQIQKAGGIANAAGGTANAMKNAADAEAKRKQAMAQGGGAIGSAAGTAIGGPVGGAIGGALGGAVGGML